MGRKAAPTKAKPLPVKRSSSPKLVIDAAQMAPRCFICDEMISGKAVPLILGNTRHSKTRMPTKIGQLMGDGYMVVVSQDDLLCLRCVALLNHLDKLEGDLKIVRKALIGYLKKKYHLGDDTSKQKLFPDGEIVNGEEADITGEENDAGAKEGSADESSALIADSGATAEDSGHSASEPMETDAAAGDGLDIVKHEPGESGTEEAAGDSNTYVDDDLEEKLARLLGEEPVQATPKKDQPEKKKLYKCSNCNFKSFNISDVKPHIATCGKGQSQFKCGMCNKIFTKRADVKTHVMEEHLKKWTCHFCEQTFNDDATYSSHMQTHISADSSESTAGVGSASIEEAAKADTAYGCSVCEFQTSDKTVFDEHCRKHATLRAFKCKICGQIFEKEDMLTNHMKTHKKLIFKCGLCSTLFKEKADLVKHLQNHKAASAGQPTIEPGQTLLIGPPQPTSEDQAGVVGARPSQSFKLYKCTRCTFQTYSKPDIKAHVKAHKMSMESSSDGSQQAPADSSQQLKCEACSLTFLNEMLYLQHMKHHEQNQEAEGASLPAGQVAAASMPLVDEPEPMEQTGEGDAGQLSGLGSNIETDKIESSGVEGTSNVQDDVQKNEAGICKDGNGCSTPVGSLEGAKGTDSSTEQQDADKAVQNSEAEKVKLLVCGMCGIRTLDKEVLKVHIKSHGNEKIYKCYSCGKDAKSPQDLMKHMKTHTICMYCNEVMINVDALEKHVEEFHPDKTRQCRLCLKMYPTKEIRVEHEKKHFQVETFGCHCGKKFPTEASRKKHEETVHEAPEAPVVLKKEDTSLAMAYDRKRLQGRKRCKCMHCNKIFKSRKTLKWHLKLHARIYKVQCPLCNREFPSHGGLEEHMSEHKHRKRYTCKTCNRKFAFYNSFMLHCKWHKDPFHYKCHACNKKFHSLSLLTVHKRQHTRDQIHSCPQCCITFADSSTLKKHLISHTDIFPYSCKICQKGFAKLYTYGRHLAAVHRDNSILKQVKKRRSNVSSSDTKSITRLADESVSASSMEDEKKNLSEDTQSSSFAGEMMEDDILGNSVPVRTVDIEGGSETREEGMGDSSSSRMEDVISGESQVAGIGIEESRVVNIVVEGSEQSVANVNLEENAAIMSDLWYE